MMVESVITLIALWCKVDDNSYTKISREMCVEFQVNCVIDNKGGLTENNERLQWCIRKGQQRLQEIPKND